MFHFQTPVNDWPRAVGRLPARCLVKGVGWQHVMVDAKAANPNINTSFRMVRDAWQHYDGGWLDWEEAKRRARIWFGAFVDGTFYDQIQHACDSVQFHNEVWANSQTQAEWDERVAANNAASYVWNTEYRPTFDRDIKLVLSTAAVGNDMDRRTAVTALADDAIVGYHPYSHWSKQPDGTRKRMDGDWRWLSGRWEQMELAWGLKPEWIFPEAGPFESALTGWRSDECLGGDRNLYVAAVREFVRDIQQTAAYRDGRIHGFALFTSGRASDVWKGFWTEQPELDMIADMLAVEWAPGTYVPPPPPDPEPPPPVPQPDPDPSQTVPYVVVVNLLPQEATLADKQSVVELVHDTRETILQSADDAARLVAPGQPGSRVVAWDWWNWPGDIVEWLAARGVSNVELRDIPDINLQSDGGGDTIRVFNSVGTLPVHDWKTYGTRKLDDITTLTIHHTVSPTDRTIASIAAYHVSRGWPGIGYHYVINDRGEIYQTNYLSTVSYHSYGNNTYSVGISLQGDFTDRPPPDIQLFAASWLVTDIENILGRTLDVVPHRNMPNVQTACPGDTWEQWWPNVVG